MIGNTGTPAVQILHIEDDPTDALLVRTQIEDYDRLDTRVNLVDRLSKGIEALHTQRYDVVLLDLILPDADGHDGLHKLLSDTKNAPPVIVLSGYNDKQLAKTALEKGAQDFILKRNLGNYNIGSVIEKAICRQCLADNHVHCIKLLEENESRVRSVIEFSTDAMAVIDCDGIIRFVNPAATHMFGRSAQALLNAPFGFPVSSEQIFELDIMPRVETAASPRSARRA